MHVNSQQCKYEFQRAAELQIRCVPMMNTLASNFFVAARAVLPIFFAKNSKKIHFAS